MYFPPVPRGNKPGPLYLFMPAAICGRVTVRFFLEFTVIRSPNEMSTLSVSSVIVNYHVDIYVLIVTAALLIILYKMLNVIVSDNMGILIISSAGCAKI